MKIVLGTKLYSLDEIGLMLGVTKHTAAGYIRRKKIPFTIIERKKYFTEAEIKTLVSPCGK